MSLPERRSDFCIAPTEMLPPGRLSGQFRPTVNRIRRRTSISVKRIRKANTFFLHSRAETTTSIPRTIPCTRCLNRYISKVTVTLPNDTLKKPGKIDGTVRLSGGEDCRTVLIMIIGSDANAITGPVDTSGVFFFNTLAQGYYRIRFLSTLGCLIRF